MAISIGYGVDIKIIPIILFLIIRLIKSTISGDNSVDPTEENVDILHSIRRVIDGGIEKVLNREKTGAVEEGEPFRSFIFRKNLDKVLRQKWFRVLLHSIGCEKLVKTFLNIRRVTLIDPLTNINNTNGLNSGIGYLKR